ncbi:hypothetical protein PV08_04530 [Exophiala spinifera]|uniref:DUF6594 domain-containing protein n=1 Tax=Exophiala spinifera TaxID=91928 RepID=A0A0D2BEB8_9EURO|nr:uncharacterized protein PV08_04530 [Exophiala spinifera]KIW17338.1 hypothetical protein PV08_04530 [Exophiala spinifera]
MAAVIAPIELPTGRRSYLNPAPGPDIHDPNWIPVLDGAQYKPPSPSVEKEVLPFSPSASFSLFPIQSQTTSPKPRPPLSHNYSKSSLAPESTASDSTSQSPSDNVEPLPSLSSLVDQAQGDAGGNHRRKTSLGSRSTEEKISVGRDTPVGDVTSARSTEESLSVAEERPFARPGQHDGQTGTRPSTPSGRKTVVLPPTSKYNRKPVASVSTVARPSFAASLPQTPQDSPRLGPTIPTTTPSTPLSQAPPSPRLVPADLPPPPQQPESVPKLHPMKSSASERRLRALHSHPSNISLRSPRNSTSDDAEIPSKPQSVRKPRKSTDSRATTRSAIYDAQMPTPAPTTPLPQLPPEAWRPPTRDNNASQNSTPALPSEPFLRATEKSETASFMTEKNMLVFRRFDNVHVKLLRCLQDEISQLEKELAKLEDPTTPDNSGDNSSQKMRVLRELRKVVAEYDHLFTAWSKMQANKASESTTQDLKQWLQRPGTSAGAGLGIDVRHDMQWLEENKNDLSAIDFNEKDEMSKKPASKSTTSNNGAASGFLSLFNCAGKRK